jgi:hypothetical protein
MQHDGLKSMVTPEPDGDEPARVFCRFTAEEARYGRGDYAPYATAAEFNKDMLLATTVSDAVTVDDEGNVSSSRPEPGSLAEREARAAMARLLRAGSRKDCGEACRSFVRLACSDLADLLDPGSKRDQFELALKRRSGKKGPARSDALEEFLALYLAHHVVSDGWVEAAISDAVKDFGISAAKAWDIWKRDGKPRYDIWKRYGKPSAPEGSVSK